MDKNSTSPEDVVKVLIIEDNPHEAELTLRALEKNNIKNGIHVVKDGAEAIDFIFAQGDYSSRNINNLPKVILLDLKLPKLTGHEVLKQLRSDERTKKIPIVALTSSKEDSDIINAYELGANSYIVKPVDFDSFIQAMSILAKIGLF